MVPLMHLWIKPNRVCPSHQNNLAKRGWTLIDRAARNQFTPRFKRRYAAPPSHPLRLYDAAIKINLRRKICQNLQAKCFDFRTRKKRRISKPISNPAQPLIFLPKKKLDGNPLKSRDYRQISINHTV